MPSDKAVVHVIDDDEAMQIAGLPAERWSAEVRTYESATAFLAVASRPGQAASSPMYACQSSAASIFCAVCENSSSAFR
jgi:hypothetical protein